MVKLPTWDPPAEPDLPDNVRHLDGPGLLLRGWLVEGTQDSTDDVDRVAEDLPEARGPRFPSGVEQLDRRMFGGLEGLTACVGGPKLGKSHFAMRCSIAACQDGWQSIYLNAELRPGELQRRLHDAAGYTGQPPAYLRGGRWRAYTPMGARAPWIFVDKLAKDIRATSNRVLFVLDSINRMVSIGKQNNYFADMTEWIEMFRVATLVSNGRIAALIVAEESRAGIDKGDKLRYASDVFLQIKRVENGPTIKFEVPLSRSGPPVWTDPHRLEWKCSRFEREESWDQQ